MAVFFISNPFLAGRGEFRDAASRFMDVVNTSVDAVLSQKNWSRGWIVLRALVCGVVCVAAAAVASAGAKSDYPLGPGDAIKIQVFQNPDLTLETRVSESGTISYPLLGSVELGGLSVAQAEQRIRDGLQQGGFLQNPQVSILLMQIRGNQVSVLGQVARPGRFPLETANIRLTDMLANAGGAVSNGDDIVIVTGMRDGQSFRKEVDIPAIFLHARAEDDIVLEGGDIIYVHRAPVFYIYGEVQRPGAYRVERSMTVMQAIALGGGPTARGSEKRLRLHRKNEEGVVTQMEPKLTDAVQPNDVLYVRESIF